MQYLKTNSRFLKTSENFRRKKPKFNISYSQEKSFEKHVYYVFKKNLKN